MQHLSHGLKIINNTVINNFQDFIPDRKREADYPNYPRDYNTNYYNEYDYTPDCLENTGDLMIRCSASQGYERPVWTTDNQIVGGEGGVIPEEGETFRQTILSNYTAGFFIESISAAANGMYSCVSQTSGAFAQFYLTVGKLQLFYNEFIKSASLDVVLHCNNSKLFHSYLMAGHYSS